MGTSMGEKMLGAELPEALVDQFMQQAEDADCKKKVALRAAVKLWVDLSPEMQRHLRDVSLSDQSFLEMVHEMLEERVDEGDRAGEKLVGRQGRKPGQKGR